MNVVPCVAFMEDAQAVVWAGTCIDPNFRFDAIVPGPVNEIAVRSPDLAQDTPWNNPSGRLST